MGFPATLALVALVGAGETGFGTGREVPQAAVERAAAGDDVAAPAPAPPRADADASAPPPSAWDRQQHSGETPASEEGRGLVEQLVRTVLSLAAVVAVIYVLGRLARARLGRLRGPGGAGLRVVERVQLDARHALFVLEVAGKRRFLVGAGGDEGVRLIAELESAAGQPTSGEIFADTMRATGGPASRAGGSQGPG